MNTTRDLINNSSKEDDHHCEYAMQLVNASVLPMVLKACIDLDVLEIIRTAGPDTQLSSSQIASQLHCHDQRTAAILIDRMLSLLASYSILTCSVVVNSSQSYKENQVQRVYSLAPVSKYFLKNANGVSLAPLLQVNQDKIMMDIWYHLNDAVIQGGIPFNRAYGMNANEYIGKDLRYLQLFKTSMTNYNSMFMEKILDNYKGFEGFECIVDVGGGDGSILKAIVSKFPTIKGINFDISPVIEHTAATAGIVHVAGDMFISIPKGDAIFMKWILHSWDDEHCVTILKNCHEALPEHGKVMIVELVVPESPESRVGIRSKLQFDLIMMNMNPGGRERTQREFKTLAERAGFPTLKVECSFYNFSLLELYK